ncbi:carboxymuconolactone decarboxylase family protein [Pseudodesulfovibrio sp. zrk46]|uniref:carboxymuconolactone decarboxylase family protein n=1 Tax=Pseudodesulfovibrio sp. zrk46 TaxID=2725288 RepID=UPI001449BDAE|nr:carboxymuconolactone decarboxylase family protein [Pseudodesulfovibrio sp. zrk46]QJB56766.1 carboxymuconolactone decarboxylase family protein [Pseudodesulfovibrio sp. zrk46]
MTESQIALKNSIGEGWETYTKLMPEIVDVYDPLQEEVYKDGDIKAKYKRMMAIVGALVKGCDACILYQTEEAFNAGATVDELLECCAVAVALGGSMAGGEVTKLVRLLKEMGKIEE